MSDKKEEGFQTMDESRLRGKSQDRPDRAAPYEGGYAGPNGGGPADEQKKE